ncbi:MAG: type III-A CRISPR-associated protein Csm2 [Syntrophales bacterium]
MGDWKNDSEKHPNYAGSGVSGKTCAKCGKPLKNDKFKYCFSCNEGLKSSGGSGGPVESTLPQDYLSKGYFDDKGNLFERYVVGKGDADLIAKQLGLDRPAMTNHQLRRFYRHVRAAENRLKMTDNFPAVYIDLKRLEPFVAEAKGKSKIPELFYIFMTKNLSAVKTEKDFLNGFLEHFQAVVAFFTFYHPKK